MTNKERVALAFGYEGYDDEDISKIVLDIIEWVEAYMGGNDAIKGETK